jgi:hypothetical protein
MGRGNAAAKLTDASFTADTAAKTGKPERTIRRDATRAKALGAGPGPCFNTSRTNRQE